MIARCETCKHWHRWRHSTSDYGKCSQICESVVCQYRDDQGSTCEADDFRTHESFGCVLHEPNETRGDE